MTVECVRPKHVTAVENCGLVGLTLHVHRPPLLTYLPPADIIAHPGLRIVLVRGVPSPWSQAAKAIFEIKGLPYVAAPLEVAGANAEIAAWSGQNSAPVVAWQGEPPINRWLDILLLAERLEPAPALLPADPLQRALAIGLGHEMLGAGAE